MRRRFALVAFAGVSFLFTKAIEHLAVDLREADLAGQNLSRFCFAGANLDGATLKGCSDTTFTKRQPEEHGLDGREAYRSRSDRRGSGRSGHHRRHRHQPLLRTTPA
jgi:hypothetical protein